MIALLHKKLTLVLLLFFSELRFLLASPYTSFPPTEANPKQSWRMRGQTSPTGVLSRTDTYDHFYDEYQRFYDTYFQMLVAPWLSGPPRNHHAHSSPAHHLPAPSPYPHIENTVSHPSGSDTMVRIFLDEHNKVRNSYGAPELVWNPDLVTAAKRVTDTCTFKHTVNNQFGENIAAGQTTPQQVVSQWVDGPEEKTAYNPNSPQDSHFTQVVWHSSREIGCAVTSCTTMTGVSLPQSPIQFWACEYNPPGNVETLYLKNVHAAAGGASLKLSSEKYKA